MSAPLRGLCSLLQRLLGTRDPGTASSTRERGARVQDQGSPVDQGTRLRRTTSTEETTSPLSIERVQRMLTGPMGYGVQRHEDEGHACLLGTWDGFPFVIEEPEDHPGWLLVSGDAQDPVSPGQRDEVAASVNDWNRDKYYPTVCLVETPVGTVVRATYLVDLSHGATSEQLRLHLDTALSACTQALSRVGPLLPEL